MDNRKPTLRALCAATVCAFLMVSAVPAVADYEAGKAAWQAGRVAEAVAQWRAAADGGDRQAMLELGRLYVQGLGVPQSYVQAHVWLNLSASRGEVEALKERDALAAKMTPQQVAAAQERALSWRPGGGSTPEAETSERESAARQGEAGSGAGPPPRRAIEEAQGWLARLEAELRQVKERKRLAREEKEREWRDLQLRTAIHFNFPDDAKDCEVCPEMVVIPAGEYMMGSPAGEKDRDSDEGPQHQVRIGRPIAVGKYEVTFEEWDACVEDGGCGGYKPDDGGWGRGRRPAVNVSWKDAKAYVAWLSEKTEKGYRLLSEAEWEYAARAGTMTARYWGEEETGHCGNVNGADMTAKRHKSSWTVASCEDGYSQTAPVGSFGVNGFGLHDVMGNVWEWVEDCWHKNYTGAPTDGSAWTTGGRCSLRVLRGGSWFDEPRRLRSAVRGRYVAGNRNVNSGFRVARTLAR